MGENCKNVFDQAIKLTKTKLFENEPVDDKKGSFAKDKRPNDANEGAEVKKKGCFRS